jgi:peroxiredoxin Q/BCP
VVLGVSADPAPANKAFRDKFGFPYDLLSDVDLTMSIAYGAAQSGAKTASRVSVLIGPDGKVAACFDPVKPDAHADEVLAELARLAP